MTHKEINIIDYIETNFQNILIEPSGANRFKAIQPNNQKYKNQVWDWDSLILALAYSRRKEFIPYVKGTVDLFLNYLEKDGFTRFVHHADNPVYPYEEHKLTNPSKPILAQMAMLVYENDKDINWIKSIFPKLQKFHSYWENNQYSSLNGLFYWRHHRGCGADNHPGLYGRPQNTILGVELNSFFYNDYRIMSKFAQLIGADKNKYIEKAEALKNNINKKMWDNEDGFYYNLDIASNINNIYGNVAQNPNWTTFLKIKHAISFLPLVFGIATKKQAKRVITEHMLNRNRFLSKYGIRSLSKTEPLYSNTDIMHLPGSKGKPGPCNWHGPIWTVINYFSWTALLRYGYKKEAHNIRNLSINLLLECLKNKKMFMEYFNAETGEGIGVKNFFSFNTVILPIINQDIYFK